MELLFELIIQLLTELLFPIIVEFLVEIGLASLAEGLRNRKARSPLLAALGYILLGAAAGALSLLVFPRSFVRSDRLHGISLIVNPTLAGGAMALMGRWRRRRGDPTIRLDSFLYGFLFALAMTLPRFLFAK
ncbi:MAG TPA: hypothetical protein VFV34_02310 [Blastocatellia bacterium]|nr:hypothetical protein [Blastocatellia bacterium]